MSDRLPSAKGPTWLWIVVLAAIVGAMAYVRLVTYPDQVIPLAYGLPLLLFIWKRDLRLLWGMTAGLAAILVAKWGSFLFGGAQEPDTGFFFLMQLAGLAVPAIATHFLIVQSRVVEETTRALHMANAELESANEELAAREEEVSQQNEELHSQAAELEHQAEEYASQAEELQATNEQLMARERTIDRILTLSAAGAGEEAVLANLGVMLEQLFAPRVEGAAILERRGATTAVHPVFGITPMGVPPRSDATFADLVLTVGQPAYIADLALRDDLVVPLLATGARPRSVIAAPGHMDGPTRLSLELYASAPGSWSDLELQLAQWCADQCARLWTTARLREDLSLMADSERAARAQAERASHEKDEFVATLAHELRTPVGAILGWASLLRTIATSPAELEKGLEVIERNARQQSRLISDLLDMSRAVGGKLHVELSPVALSEVVDAAIDEQRPAAAARGITLERDDGVLPVLPVVLGDNGRLQQVVGNVLTNAIKFTARGGAVRVTVRCDDAMAYVEVRDTGRGIRPELIPSLFDRYRQADSSSSRSHGGLGLGLAIARHILDLHSGAIALSSDGEGQGATCIVSLPRLAAAHPADDANGGALDEGAHGNGDARQVLAGVSILVVDDDDDTLDVVARILEEGGAAVSRARRASEALAMLQAVRPSLLVSDIGMPEMDGYELVRRVRQQGDDGLRTIPAIAITAFARPGDRMRALESGFQLHLPKPLDPATLLGAAVQLVGREKEPGRADGAVRSVKST